MYTASSDAEVHRGQSMKWWRKPTKLPAFVNGVCTESSKRWKRSEKMKRTNYKMEGQNQPTQKRRANYTTNSICVQSGRKFTEIFFLLEQTTNPQACSCISTARSQPSKSQYWHHKKNNEKNLDSPLSGGSKILQKEELCDAGETWHCRVEAQIFE